MWRRYVLFACVVGLIGLGQAERAGWGAENSSETREVRKPVSPPRIEDFAPPDEFVSVGSIKTHFVAKGAQGPALVLIHGFGCSTATWEKNIDELSKRFRVFALDLKGFGLSAKPKDGQYHLHAFTEHVLGFLDVMKLDKAVLVGNSMGGAVATRLALLHPDRVAGLVLVDAIPAAFPRPSLPLGRTSAEPLANAKGKPRTPPLVAFTRAMITRQTIASGLKSAFHDQALITDSMIETHYRPITIEGAAEALVAMLNPPPESAGTLPPLTALKVPTLVVWGRHDRLVPQPIADLYARAIPGARKVVFENSGHFPQIEEAAEFNTRLTEFVSKNL
jgi:pimeloyl-ACP methyl ester carboxylesterase